MATQYQCFPKEKQKKSDKHHRLSKQEIESLRQEMKRDGLWMKAELEKKNKKVDE